MKFPIAVIVAALASTVVAKEPDLTGLNRCAHDCFRDLVKESGCPSSEDIECLCKSQDYKKALRPCVIDACRSKSMGVVKWATEKCKRVNAETEEGDGGKNKDKKDKGKKGKDKGGDGGEE